MYLNELFGIIKPFVLRFSWIKTTPERHLVNNVFAQRHSENETPMNSVIDWSQKVVIVSIVWHSTMQLCYHMVEQVCVTIWAVGLMNGSINCARLPEAFWCILILVAFCEASAAGDDGGVLLTDPHRRVVLYTSRYWNINLGISPLVVIKFPL